MDFDSEPQPWHLTLTSSLRPNSCHLKIADWNANLMAGQSVGWGPDIHNNISFKPKTFKPQHWNSDKCVNQPFVGKLGPFVCVNQWIHVLAERVALHQISVPIRNLEMTFVWPQTNWDDIYVLSKSKLRWNLFGLKHIEMIFICSESANWDDIYLVSKRTSTALSWLLFWLREWWDSNTAKFCLSRSKWGNTAIL